MESPTTSSDKAESVTKNPGVVVATSPESARPKALAVNGSGHPAKAHHHQHHQSGHNAQNAQGKGLAQVTAKPNSQLRKMSTMMEEDSSDDLDNDCPNR
jgi:hypothetical protein